MSIYETIFKRRSVRQFDMRPLSSDLLSQIKDFIVSIKQIDGVDKTRFVLVDEKMTTGGIRAPHYFLASGQEGQGACINAGYVLAELDLYLQDKGFGSIFLGMTKPVRKVDKDEFIISFGFGKSTVPLRDHINNFKRLNIDVISNADNLITQAARIAPSAVNSQPWFIDYQPENVTISYKGRGILKLVLKKKMSMVDLGIVTKFIEIALQHENKKVESINVTTGKSVSIKISFK